MACLVYNLNKNGEPLYLFEKMVRGIDTHNCNTRSCDLYTIPKHNTAQYERSFTYNATKIFNQLPCQTKSLPSISRFRKGVKSLLLIKRN